MFHIRSAPPKVSAGCATALRRSPSAVPSAQRQWQSRAPGPPAGAPAAAAVKLQAPWPPPPAGLPEPPEAPACSCALPAPGPGHPDVDMQHGQLRRPHSTRIWDEQQGHAESQPNLSSAHMECAAMRVCTRACLRVCVCAVCACMPSCMVWSIWCKQMIISIFTHTMVGGMPGCMHIWVLGFGVCMWGCGKETEEKGEC